MAAQFQATLGAFMRDPSPLVRSAATAALVQLHKQGVSIDVELYSKAVEAVVSLSDRMRADANGHTQGWTEQSEEVRLHGLELIYALAKLHPRHVVSKYR